MSTVNSTVTIDTGEFVYIDVTGIGHTVTNGQTFQLRIDDNSTTDVQYYLASGQTPITTTDGYKLTFRPLTQTANPTGTGSNAHRTVGPLTDAGEGSNFSNLRGELAIECPVTGILQRWKVVLMNSSNADFNAAGTITMTLEDQFGHTMVIPAPAVGGSVTVGQAA